MFSDSPDSTFLYLATPVLGRLARRVEGMRGPVGLHAYGVGWASLALDVFGVMLHIEVSLGLTSGHVPSSISS